MFLLLSHTFRRPHHALRFVWQSVRLSISFVHPTQDQIVLQKLTRKIADVVFNSETNFENKRHFYLNLAYLLGNKAYLHIFNNTQLTISAVTIIDIDIDIAIYFRYRSISISRYMLVFWPRFSLQWFDALHRCADCARFDQNPRTHVDANFRIRTSLMLCSSRPSATRRQTDAISLLSTPCADPTPLGLIVSYVISPSPAAVVHLAGRCVLFSESTSILQPLSRINL